MGLILIVIAAGVFSWAIIQHVDKLPDLVPSRGDAEDWRDREHWLHLHYGERHAAPRFMYRYAADPKYRTTEGLAQVSAAKRDYNGDLTVELRPNSRARRL